jgi:hypothetical protein
MMQPDLSPIKYSLIGSDTSINECCQFQSVFKGGDHLTILLVFDFYQPIQNLYKKLDAMLTWRKCVDRIRFGFLQKKKQSQCAMQSVSLLPPSNLPIGIERKKKK